MRVTGTGPGSTERARDIGGAGGATQVGSTRDKKKARAASEADPAGATEKISISGKARESAKAKEVAKAAPDVDEAKIAQFKKAIESGAYKVDADKVADRLVDEHLATSF